MYMACPRRGAAAMFFRWSFEAHNRRETQVSRNWQWETDVRSHVSKSYVALPERALWVASQRKNQVAQRRRDRMTAQLRLHWSFAVQFLRCNAQDSVRTRRYAPRGKFQTN